MFKKVCSKFNWRVAVIILAVLFVGMAGAGVFSNLGKRGDLRGVGAEIVQEQKLQSDTLAVGTWDTDEIKSQGEETSVSAFAEPVESKNYTAKVQMDHMGGTAYYDISTSIPSVLENIPYGTTFSFWGSPDYTYGTISFQSGTVSYRIVVTANTGYYFWGFKANYVVTKANGTKSSSQSDASKNLGYLGYKDSSNHQSQVESLSIQQIDPSYAGEFEFVGYTKEILYDLEVFHMQKNNLTKLDTILHEDAYGVDTIFTIPDPLQDNLPEGYLFDCWVLDAKTAQEKQGYTISFYMGMVILTGSNIQVTFTGGQTFDEDGDGSVDKYAIINVSGYGELDQLIGSDSTPPIIIAKLERNYAATVYSYEYGESITSTDWSEYVGLSTVDGHVTPTTNRLLKYTGARSLDYFSRNFQLINSSSQNTGIWFNAQCTNYPFMATGNRAFWYGGSGKDYNSLGDFSVEDYSSPEGEVGGTRERGWFVYNYGHRVVGYTVMVDVNHNEYLFLSSGSSVGLSTGFSFVTSQTNVPILELKRNKNWQNPSLSYEENFCLDDLAKMLDDKYGTEGAYVNVQIYPVWEEASVDVTYKKDTSDEVVLAENMKFGQDYDFGFDEVPKIEGKTVYAYKGLDDLGTISEKGVWNYSHLKQYESEGTESFNFGKGEVYGLVILTNEPTSLDNPLAVTDGRYYQWNKNTSQYKNVTTSTFRNGMFNASGSWRASTIIIFDIRYTDATTGKFVRKMEWRNYATYLSNGQDMFRSSPNFTSYAYEVEAQYVDNIYKVGLTNAPYDTVGSAYNFELKSSNGSFTYAATVISDTYFDYKSNLYVPSANGDMSYYCYTFDEYKENFSNSFYNGFIDQYLYGSEYLTAEKSGADLSENGALVPSIEAYKEGIDGDRENDFSIFDNVHYSSATKITDYKLEATKNTRLWVYLANDQTVRALPSFGSNGASTTYLARTLGWDTSDETKAFKSDFFVEEQDGSNSSAIMIEMGDTKLHSNWEHGNGSSLASHNVYAVNGYYEISYDPVVWSSIYYQYFGSKITMDMGGNSGLGIDQWYFDIDQARTDGYNVEVDATNKKLSVTGGTDNVNITILYSENKNNAYFISADSADSAEKSITGTGQLFQKADAPIIKPVWKDGGGQIYFLTIDNSETYWKELPLSEIAVSAGTVYGAVALDGTNGLNQNGDLTKFTYAINTGTQAQFMKNTGLAFKKYNDLIENLSSGKDENNTYHQKLDDSIDNNSYYLVYNYGHTITGWKMWSENLGQWIHYDGTSVSLVDNEENAKSTLADLENFTWGDLASALYDLFLGSGLTPTVIAYPVWEAQAFTVTYKDSNGKSFSTGVTYASDDYEIKLDANFTKPVGQELYSLKFGDGSLVALKGVWNYVSTNADYGYIDGTYTLTLGTLYLNNIYRFNLTNYLTTDPDGTLTLDTSKTGYSFVPDAHKKDVNKLTFTSQELSYVNKKGEGKSNYKYNSYTQYKVLYATTELIEQFTLDGENGFLSYKNNWEEGTTKENRFNFFDKIHYEDASSSRTNTINVGSASNYESSYVLWIYIANGQTVGNLPVFENDYAKNYSWSNALVTSNTTSTAAYSTAVRISAFDETRRAEIDAQITTVTDEISFMREKEAKISISDFTSSEPTDAISLYANYVYCTDLYYEQTAGDYGTEKTGWYLKEATTQILSSDGKTWSPGVDNTDLPNGKTFGGWIFDIALAEKSHTVTEVKTGVYRVTISDNKYYDVYVWDKVPYATDVYYIKALGGIGIIFQEPPFLRAKILSTYDLKIDNSKSGAWNGLNDDAEESKLYGAFGFSSNPEDTTTVNRTMFSSDGSSWVKADAVEPKDFTWIKFKIANDETYAYSFMKSILGTNSTVFWHREDFDVQENTSIFPTATRGYYYVYNYGYYIYGWKVTLSNGQELFHNGMAWSVASGTSAVSNLLKASFADLAAIIDGLNAGGAGIDSLTLKPIWAAVKLKITNNDESITISTDDFVYFNKTYGIDKTKEENEKEEKEKDGIKESSIIAYYYQIAKQAEIADSEEKPLYSQDNLIALGGTWNYAKIDNEQFGYDSQGTYGAGPYTLKLNPVYVSNIIKITLSEAPTADGKTFNLSETGGITFSTSTQNKDADVYDYSTIGEEFKLATYESGYIDDFIQDLSSSIEEFNSIVANGFSIYNTVHHSGVTRKGDYSASQNDKATASFWIYLAHDKSVDGHVFPTFETDLAKTIFWHAGEKPYAYKTKQFDVNDYDENEKKGLNSEISLFQPAETTTWSITVGLKLTAHNVYGIRGYYETGYGATEFTSQKLEIFALAINLTMGVPTITQQDSNSNKSRSIAGWYFDVAVATEKGYKITKDGEWLIVNDGEIHFHTTGVNDESKRDGEKKYYIDKVYGSGQFLQDETNPIIRARWATNYDMTIVNNSTYWANKDLDKVGLEVSDVYGVVFRNSLGILNTENFNSFTYNFEANDDYSNIKFGSNYGHVFKQLGKLNESTGPTISQKLMNGEYYFIYNYGHKLNGWIINLKINNGTEIIDACINVETIKTEGQPITYQAGVVAGEVKTVGYLDFLTWKVLASTLDEYSTSTGYSIESITASPDWSAQSFNVTFSDAIGNNFNKQVTYGGTYGLTTADLTGFTSPVGQSLYQHKFKNSDGVALSGVWNYVKNGDSYVFSENEVENIYTLSLTPEYVDNIYRFNLTNYLTTSTSGELTVDDSKTPYRFVDKGSLSSTAIFNFENYEKYTKDHYEFKTYDESGGGWIELYIEEKLTSYKSSWEALVGGGSSLFGKIHHSNAIAGENQTSINVGTATNYKIDYDLWIYIANNAQMLNLPVFKNDMAQNYAYSWVKDSTKAYGTAFRETSELESRSESLDKQICSTVQNVGQTMLISNHSNSEPTGALSLNAEYVYRVYLYYRDNNSGDGVYSIKKTDWYLLESRAEIFDEDRDPEWLPNVATEEQPSRKEIFDGWVLDLKEVNNQKSKYSIEISGSLYTVTEISSGSTIKIITNGDVAGNGNLRYISQIGGSGIFVQDDTAPILKADYMVVYDVTIDNSSTIWNNEYSSELEASEQQKLFGAYAYTHDGINKETNLTQTTDFNKVTFNVTYKDQYKYSFMNSVTNGNPTVFYHNTDFSAITNSEDFINKQEGEIWPVPNSKRGYYYVYNYGHYISAWKVTLSNGTYLVWNGSNWTPQTESSKANSTIENLANANFAYLAQTIDEMNRNGAGVFSFTLTPIWTEATIRLINKDNKALIEKNFFFNKEYAIKEGVDASIGQSVIAYCYNSSNAENTLVASFQHSGISGVWNYTEIGAGEYGFAQNKDGAPGQGVYQLTLYPIFVDNIYHFNLNSNITNTNGELVIDEDLTDYRFTTDENKKLLAAKYTFDTYDDLEEYGKKEGYAFVAYMEQSKALMENYVVDMWEDKGDWETGLAGGSEGFAILKLIQHEDATKAQSNTVVKVDVTSNYVTDYGLWIYLANNQYYDRLPAFKNDLAQNYSWSKTSVTNGSDKAIVALATEFRDSDEVKDRKTEIDNEITTNMKASMAKLSIKDDGFVGSEPSISLNLYANHVYRINLYYEDRDSSDGKYTPKYTDWYLLLSSASLRSEDGNEWTPPVPATDTPSNKHIFDGWMFDYELATNKKDGEGNKVYTVTETDNGFTVKVNATGNYVDVYTDGYVQNVEELFYIKNIGGFGIFMQDALDPILRANYTLIYAVTIDNSSTMWSTSPYNEALTTEEKEKLFGAFAFSHDGINTTTDLTTFEGFSKVTFDVANNEFYKYAFMNSQTDGKTTVFYHNTDFEGVEAEDATLLPNSERGYYYIYNYGHYISHWILTLDNGTFLVWNGSEWKTEANGELANSAINSLADCDFTSFAAKVDSLNAGRTTIYSLTLTPVWESADIQLLNAAGTQLNTDALNYGEDYAINLTFDAKTGQSVMAYSYDSEDVQTTLVAAAISDDISGTWNYTNIKAYDEETGAGEYSFAQNTSGIPGDCVYQLTLYPIYGDNIYRFNLNKYLKTTKSGEVQIDETQTAYRYITEEDQILEGNKYTFETYDDLTYYGTQDAYTFVAYADQKELMMEDYAEVLWTYTTDWQAKVKGSFSIFNKIHHDISNLQQQSDPLVVNLSATKVIVGLKSASDYESNYEMWIYLANNQNINNLPAFMNDSAKNYSWSDLAVNETQKATIAYGTAFRETTNISDRQSEIDAQILASDHKSNMNSASTVMKISNHSTEEPEEAIDLYANYVYRMKLYYEDRDSSDGNYSSKQTDWYLLQGATILSTENEDGSKTFTPEVLPSELPVRKPTFEGWIFNRYRATEETYSDGGGGTIYGYEVTDVTWNEGTENEVKVLKLTFDKTNKNFVYIYYTEEKIANRPELYFVEKIGGYGIFEQLSAYPIFTAKLAAIYDVIIDNSYSETWASANLTDEEKEKLQSVYVFSHDGIDKTTNITKFSKDGTNWLTAEEASNEKYLTRAKFDVANTSEYEYGFMSSAIDGSPTTFYHKDDFEGIVKGNETAKLPSSLRGFYYVHNYGYYISGWQIRLDLRGIYLYFDASGNWQSEEGVSHTIDINDLVGTNFTSFAGFAAQADAVYATDAGNLQITLIPKWERTTIQLENESETELTNKPFNFDKLYAITPASADTEVGHTIIAYSYDSENPEETLIASVVTDGQSGKWNYSKIDNNYYAFAQKDNGAPGDGLYILTLYPINVENVYKVNLENPIKSAKNTYEFKAGTDYKLNSDVGVYDNGNDYYELTFQNTFKYGVNDAQTYSFKTYPEAEITLIDAYIEKLKEYKDTYLNGIDVDDDASDVDFSLFRKIYHSAGEVAEGSENLKLLAAESKFNIYLVHSYPTGVLPVFLNDYRLHIFWENTETNSASETYAYLTTDFEAEDEDHVEDLSKFVTHDDGTWHLTDGNPKTLPEALKAHYFRKSYPVQISTLFENDVARKGYALVRVTDVAYEIDKNFKDESGNFMAICEANEMVLYSLKSVNLDTFAIKSFAELKTLNKATRVETVDDEGKQYIKLFAGCDIELIVKDQSQDATSMATGNFDEMIGYKFNKELNQTVKEKDILVEKDPLFATSDYHNLTTAEEIATRGYINGAVLNVDVLFAKIEYDLGVYLTYLETGRFKVQKNAGGYSALLANTIASPYGISKALVDDEFNIYYYAYAGFTLEENAFMLYHTVAESHTLQTYDDSLANGRGNNQTLTFVMSGKWLRENFYSKYQTNYAIYPDGENKPTDVGDVAITTESIEFDYGLRTYDYINTNNLEEGKQISERKAMSSFSLSVNDGKGTTVPVGQYLTEMQDVNLGRKLYYYVADKTYALLNSRMYYPDNALTIQDNHYTEYEFPLMTKSNVGYVLTYAHIANMVNGYSEGIIIASDDRCIDIMLEISLAKLEKLDIELEMHDSATHDPNLSDRSVSVVYSHNGTSNTWNALVSKSSNFEFVNASPWNTTNSKSYYFPSFIGLNLTLGETYDETHYTGVEYYQYLNTEDPNSLQVMTENSVTVLNTLNRLAKVKFLPKPLHVEYVYTLNGAETNLEELKEIISETTEFKPSTEKEFYLDDACNDVEYEIECIDPDHNVDVSINGGSILSTSNAVRKISLTGANSYTVKASDYSHGKIQIAVNVKAKDEGKIIIGFNLKEHNPDYATANDKFGTFDVWAGGIMIAEGVARSVEVSLVNGQRVEVQLNLNAGYKFVSNYTSVAENKYMLIESFDPYQQAMIGQNYNLDLEKVVVDAKIDRTGTEAEYFIEGSTGYTTTYVENSVNFTTNSIATERLQCYYYLDKGGNEIYLTHDGLDTGVALTNVVITSAMLQQSATYDAQNGKYEMIFKVKVIKRYQFNLKVEGADYLADGSPAITGNGVPTVSGEYHDENSKIVVTAMTVITGKYDIIFNGQTRFIIEGEEVDFNVFNMTQDYSLTMKIQPTKFTIGLTERLYSTLAEVENGEPVAVTGTDTVNNLQVNGRSDVSEAQYDTTTRLSFVADKKGNKARRLSKVTLVHDGKEIVVELDQHYSADGLDIGAINNELKARGFGDYVFSVVSKSNEELVIAVTYKTQSDISLTLDYKQYKIITSK